MSKVYGIGLNDYDKRVSYIEDGKKKFIKSYVVWREMLRRCCSVKFQEKCHTYKGCKVSQEWTLYSNFKNWFDNNYPSELAEEIKFELDKDLLSVDNKIYSKETCLFIPQRINKFLTNKKSTNKTGFKGVSLKKDNNKFRARINNFETRKEIHLGRYDTESEAGEAYAVARKYMSILARNYMANLGIYSEEVINKIK